MSPRSLAALLLCGGLFGLSYVFVRVAAPAVGPVGVTAVRTVIGGGLLCAVARWRHVPVRLFDLRYVGLGAVSAAVPWTLIAVATDRLDAGTSAVVNASAPVFALALGAVEARRRPEALGLVGMALALTGILVVMTSRGVGFGPGWQLGLVAGVVGAFVFAGGGFVAARWFKGVPVLAVAAGQQIGAAALLVPVAIVLAVVGATPRAGPAPSGIVALVLLGVLGSGLAYLLFYWLIENEGPVRTATVNLVVPVSGVVWSALLLRESVSWIDAVGVATTAVGVALVLRPTPLPDVP